MGLTVDAGPEPTYEEKMREPPWGLIENMSGRSLFGTTRFAMCILVNPGAMHSVSLHPVLDEEKWKSSHLGFRGWQCDKMAIVKEGFFYLHRCTYCMLWHVRRCNIVCGNICVVYRNIYGLKHIFVD